MNASSLLPLTLVVALAGCAKHEPTATPSHLSPARVQTARVQTEMITPCTEITGTIRPARRATLAAKVMGTVSELPVSLGQPVHAGERVLKISAVEITAKVAQAQAQLNLARRDLERERDLLAKGASTSEMVKGLEDRFAMTEALVREAETMLGYTELRAPFDGVVARKFINAGDLAAPGQPLLEIEGTTDFQVEAGLPDSLAAQLHADTTLACEAGPVKFSARLIELSPSADASTRTVAAKLAVPADAGVRSGQFVRVLAPSAPAPGLLVPAAAVSISGQMERVFVDGEGHHAVLRLVKTGAPHGNRVEILSGLSAGESVVLNPPAGLREGQPLEVQP